MSVWSHDFVKVKRFLHNFLSYSGKCTTRVIASKDIPFAHPAAVHSCFQSWSKNCSYVQQPYDDNTVGSLFYFPKAEIEMKSKVLRMDEPMLLNSFGGALGLFLGLSLVDILFMVCNGLWMAKDFLSASESTNPR